MFINRSYVQRFVTVFRTQKHKFKCTDVNDSDSCVNYITVHTVTPIVFNFYKILSFVANVCYNIYVSAFKHKFLIWIMLYM